MPHPSIAPQQRARLCLIVCTALAMSSTSCKRAPSYASCLPGYGLEQGRICAQTRTSLKLPFRAGMATTINQGHHDNPTHYDRESFAIDFSCTPDDPIVAARPGIVWDVRKDSFESCTDPSCMGQDNFVIIDHGDGTRASYHHLSPMGVTVTPGEQVCQGQLIGTCGNTGYSTGPHLHWQLNSLWAHSLPARFEEFEDDRAHPYAIPHTTYTSQNTRDTHCKETAYSDLPRDAFAHRGILLDAPFSTWHSGEEAIFIKGTYKGDEPHIALHMRAKYSKSWMTLCTTRDDSGRFKIEHNWQDLQERSSQYWVMMTGVGEECKNTHWAWSYAVKVGAFQDDLKPGEDEPLEPGQFGRDAPRMPGE